MQKSVINALRIVVLVFTLFLLVSCKGEPAAGEKPHDTAAALKLVQTGTLGVEITTMPNYPPSQIYDLNELIALVEVRNKGNYNLGPQDCFIQITGFDPNIIGGGFDQPRTCAENVGILEGKNVYNTDGSFNQIEFRSSNILLPEGVFEYNPTLNILTCYVYRTLANPLVCVDPLFYQVTREQKSCTPRDVGMGGGQGAPVGVSYVGVDMVGSKAIFEINVINNGGGTVLSPDTDIRSCTQDLLQYTDVDKVGYTVHLSGGMPISCSPGDGLVRLSNNQGKIVCSFDIAGTGAYETPLQITLDYGYIDSFQKSLKIIQTPQ